MSISKKSQISKLREACAWMNFIDPFYWIVWVVHLPFLLSTLREEEEKFVRDNMSKHRCCWWVTVVVVFCTVCEPQHNDKALEVLAFALTTAWYIISFASVPKRFIHVSMYITFFMFAAFWSSICSLSVVNLITGISTYAAVKYGIILLTGYAASVLYDTADGLKAGLDEAQLLSSRAALLWHRREHDINPEELDS